MWNRDGRLQGSLDSPLTPLGRVQAARQGAILRREGVAAPVLCSPQGRAQATAALAGLDARIDPRLSEIRLGRWEGAHLDVIDPPPGPGWKFAAPDGETRRDLDSRCDDLLMSLDGPAILVTHGVTGMVLRGMVTGRGLDVLEDRQGVVYALQDGVETVLR